MQVAKFPFTYIGKTKLGKIYRPYAEVQVFSKFYNDWIPVEMVVDTGADYTLFPKKYAKVFGINLSKDAVEEKTAGIGGTEKVFLLKKLKIRIGEISLSIPVGFLNRNDIPPLLGRLNCLEKIELIFKTKTTIFKNNF